MISMAVLLVDMISMDVLEAVVSMTVIEDMISVLVAVLLKAV